MHDRWRPLGAGPSGNRSVWEAADITAANIAALRTNKGRCDPVRLVRCRLASGMPPGMHRTPLQKASVCFAARRAAARKMPARTRTPKFVCLRARDKSVACSCSHQPHWLCNAGLRRLSCSRSRRSRSRVDAANQRLQLAQPAWTHRSLRMPTSACSLPEGSQHGRQKQCCACCMIDQYLLVSSTRLPCGRLVQQSRAVRVHP